MERSFFTLTFGLLFFFILLSNGIVDAKKKQRKFDGDFEFADEEETRPTRKEGKKTWILDPGSDLCQALKCKKKELCLLEDEFTAVCVSKKELHKNGDIILPKSKLPKEKFPYADPFSSYFTTTTRSPLSPGNLKGKNIFPDPGYDSDEDDDSDYYDDEDASTEDLFKGFKEKTEKAPKETNLDFKSSCSPCPVVRPSFICGSDNRTYSSLCRLDYHNCIQSSQIVLACKGFCPCKDTKASSDYSKYNALKKQWLSQKSQGKMGKKDFLPEKVSNSVLEEKGFVSGKPLSAGKVYSKMKDFYGKKDKGFRNHNEVINIKPSIKSSMKECNDDSLESMRARLLDWFSVVMEDAQKRKLVRKRNFEVRFPSTCKREVQWMFHHLNTEDDGQLSLQELFDLENDRSEKCMKPLLDKCDTDKDVFISPREWCNCYKQNKGTTFDEESDDEDSELDGSGDEPLEI